MSDCKGPGSRTLEDLIREGLRSEEKLDFDRTVYWFKKALQIGPTHEVAAGLNCRIGEILMGIKERDEEALQYFKKAESLGLRDDNLYVKMGEALINLGRIEEAERANLNALKVNEKSSNAHVGLGNIYYLQGELEKARNEISIALGIDDKDGLAHNSLGSILLKEERFQQAEVEFLRAIQLEDGRIEKSRFFSNLGYLYSQIGRYEESLYYLLSAISLQPRKITHHNLINTIKAMKGKDNVISQCHEFLQGNPHFAGMNYLIATLLDYVGGPGQSRGHYQRIVEMMKEDLNFSARLKTYGKSSNPVRVDVSNPFSRNMFFIKCDDKRRKKLFEMRRLEREFATATFVSETLKSYNGKARTGEPIAFFEHDDGNIYLISKAQGRRNLKELAIAEGFEGEYLKDNAVRCLLNLADIQGYVTRELDGRNDFRVAHDGNKYHIKLDRFDYNHDLDRRLFDRFGHNKSSDKVKKLMQGIINANRTSQDLFIHGDMVGANALEGGAIIDYERCCMGDPVTDAAALLTNPSFRFDAAKAFENYYNRLVDSYNRRLDFNEFRKSFAAHQLFYSMGFAGSEQFHGEYGAAKAHIKQAVSIMENNRLNDLRNCFVEYISEAFSHKR